MVFTQFQERLKTIDIVAILVSQTKEIIKILKLSKVHQFGCHDVTVGENWQFKNYKVNMVRYIVECIMHLSNEIVNAGLIRKPVKHYFFSRGGI